MKTKFLKHAARKALTIALSVTIIVSVTACKHDVDEKKSVPDKNTDKKTDISAEQTGISEYGYNIEYIDFPKELENPYQLVVSGEDRLKD